MEYTKGEWTIATSKVFGGEFYSIVGNYRNHQIRLAEICPIQKAEANAHLIASSPELYEACKELEIYRISWEAILGEKIATMLRKALAKAEVNK